MSPHLSKMLVLPGWKSIHFLKVPVLVWVDLISALEVH